MPSSTLDLDRWERHFAVNLRAPAFLARDFAAQLPAERHGCIVNIIDQRVLKPTPQFFSYTLTKAALFTATRRWRRRSRRASASTPSGRAPPWRAPARTAEAFARQSAAVPLGHGATPEEIAEAVVFLARAASVTGQMIAVDGGQHLAWADAGRRGRHGVSAMAEISRP